MTWDELRDLCALLARADGRFAVELLAWHVPADRWRALVWDRQADRYHDLDGAGAARFRRAFPAPA
nr:hypothetical protein [Chloroflexota bacterium]